MLTKKEFTDAMTAIIEQNAEELARIERQRKDAAKAPTPGAWR